MEARTDEVLSADPLMSEPLDRRGGARARGRGRHPPAADPDAVRGRAGQHLPDRGRPADAGRLGPELRARARRAPAPARRARALDRRHRAGGPDAPAHRPPRPGRHHRRRIPGAEVAAIDKLAGFAEHFREDAARDDEFASGVMLRNGIPEDIVQRAADGVVGVPGLGREGEGHAAAARRRAPGAAGPHARGAAPARATRPPTPSSGTRSAGS